jgi:hypothetical protein
MGRIWLGPKTTLGLHVTLRTGEAHPVHDAQALQQEDLDY